uniref:Reverse transcriptase domain-containing protein n=1 Tax=Solanum demissum TaxID=50514 RepID=Q6AVY2_SOLDE|nr:hypothetical protein SDM1_2t00016 [Solanum demissum]
MLKRPTQLAKSYNQDYTTSQLGVSRFYYAKNGSWCKGEEVDQILQILHPSSQFKRSEIGRPTITMLFTLVMKVLIRMMDVVVGSCMMGFSAAVGEQGVRQGDPLTPMLFTLVMKALIRMMDVVVGSYMMGFSAAVGEQGVRQGDPLSPMLFTLVMKALIRMMDVVVGSYMMGFSATVGLVGVLETSVMVRLDTSMAYWRNKMLQWYVGGT